MNAHQKTTAVDIYKNLRSRERNIRESAISKRFGDEAAARDLARADGLALALQYIEEHLYLNHGRFDVEREAGL